MTPEYDIIDDSIYVPTHCHEGGNLNISDAEVTIKQDGSKVGSFTLNQKDAAEINLAGPGSLPIIGNGTIVIKQGGQIKGQFSLNQNGDLIIDLDAGGPLPPEPDTKKYIYWGYFGTDRDNIPVIDETVVLTFSKDEVEDLSTYEIKFNNPVEKSWAFIAIRDDMLTSTANNIIYDKSSAAFAASMEDLAYDNIIINSVPYKIFIIGSRIPTYDAPVFIIKQ